MKPLLFFLKIFILLSLTISSASATIFRINNAVTENMQNKLFNQIQTAINHFSVQNGDTLMVEGSAIAYNSFTCNKRLVLIGPGYFLNENPGLNSTTYSARTSGAYCYFNNGSQGSALIGMDCTNVSIIVSNFNIIRCKGNFFFSASSSTPTANCRIISSYCLSINGAKDYNTNLSVTNSIIIEDRSSINYLNYDNNVLVSNVLWNITAGTFRNNILVDRNVAANISSPTKQNNLAPNQQFGNTNGNIAYDPNNLFVGGSSSDAKYLIKSTSPYIKAGTNGSQPGIFGGAEPYRLSGIPPIPIIYELSVPGTGSSSSGLNINIRIRNAN